MIRYQHVDTLRTAPGPPRAAPVSLDPVVEALDDSTLEPDVIRLASVELAGRKVGTEGNRLGREYIISRLEGAGLEPLFGDFFEQVTAPGGRPLGTNVGAILRATEPDAEWVVLVAHHDHLGVVRGRVCRGADDNASAVAMLLALCDALGRAKPPVRRHVVFFFPDAEEPPHTRRPGMGSTWFWNHPPLPLAKLRLAIVLDLMGGRATPRQAGAGLGRGLYVLGAEADPSLAALVGSTRPEPGAPAFLMSLPMIEATPYAPGRRFARSDYHGLREISDRPFLLLTTGRTSCYHTPEDVPESLDYERMGDSLRFLSRLAIRAAEGEEELRGADFRADPFADARLLVRFLDTVAPGDHPAMVLRAMARDREFASALMARAGRGAPVSHAEYRRIQLAGLRYQAAVWSPRRWWWGLW